MQRRADIEGLRAVAVLAVLLFHAGIPGLSGGYVGVDVFFVVSGFLITSLLVNERNTQGRIALGSFYARRVRRLLPVSALVAVTTLAASWIWLEPLRLRSLATDVLGVATFSSNLVFAQRGADYLQSTLPPSPLQHYWSLAVEEQFYLVWPVLIAIVCVGVTSQSRIGLRLRVGVVSACVSVASFAACMLLMETSQPWAFFSPHTRAFELAIGACVAVLPTYTRRASQVVGSLIAWGGLGAVIASVFLFDENTRFPGPWALVPVLGTALLLMGGNVTAWSPQRILSLAPLQWLGTRSYSAYLWHWPILIVVAASASRELTITEGLACTAIALALSEFSYRFVENPIRLNLSIRGTKAVVFAIAITALVGGSGVIARNNPPTLTGETAVTTPALSVATTTTVLTAETSTSIASAPTLPSRVGPVEPISQAMTFTGLPGNLDPSLQRALSDMPVIYKNNCHAGFSAIRPKPCIYGDPASEIVVGLYGDSHAAQWFPAFEKVAIKRGWKLILYTKRGCPPADIPTYSKVLGKVYNECGPWRENVYTQMEADGVSVVFVAFFERLLSASTKIPMWQKEWREGLQGTVDELKSRSITPVLMEDTPYPGQDVPTCLSRHYTNVHLCSASIGNGYRPDLFEMMNDFDDAGVNVLWVRDWFCTATACPTVVGNLLVYRDDNHMTVSYASYIAPLLDAAVNDVVMWYTRTS
jgi:peptidoglycan/LPS O-acetylase OafA/YrhL